MHEMISVPAVGWHRHSGKHGRYASAAPTRKRKKMTTTTTAKRKNPNQSGRHTGCRFKIRFKLRPLFFPSKFKLGHHAAGSE